MLTESELHINDSSFENPDWINEDFLDAENEAEEARIEAENDTYEWIDQLNANPTDPVRMYLREISQVPLLSPEEERDLTKNYALTKNKLAKTIETSEAGQNLDDQLQLVMAEVEAMRQRLTNSNLRLVVSIAKRYTGRGISLLDLIQEGNIGLMRALEKFDYTLGYKISTYATWWIRQAITRAIADQSRTVRLPVHVNERINKLNKTITILRKDLCREPDLGEVAEKMGVPIEVVEHTLQLAKHALSLDNPVGENKEDTVLGDFIRDEHTPLPLEQANLTLLKEEVQKSLEKLSPRQRRILDLRFGISDGQPRTLEEVGKVMGATRERIRQIEAFALSKLRRSEDSEDKEKLRVYLRD